MEATALSVGKSVLNGALGYAKSALAEEVALQLGIQRDHAFIRDELEMMLAFLMAAHDEQDKHQVVKTWVKQVRDIAYDAEDSLQDFAVRLGKPSWWRILRKLFDRHHVGKKMKELRAKVEDVSQRNQRYQLIKGSGSMAATSTGQSSMVSETMSDTEEAMRLRNKAKVDLIRLIHGKKDDDLRVIALWSTNDVFGETSIIRRVYDDLKRHNKFECQAWIRITNPFNPIESLQNIVRQFFIDYLQESARTTPGVHDLRRMRVMKEGDLIQEFEKYLNERSYMIVLCDLSTIEDWNQIKAYFPNNKKGSRLIVCTEKDEVASFCVGLETEMPEHKQLSTDPTLFAFFEKGSQAETYSMGPEPSSNVNNENGSSDEKRLNRMTTMVSAFKEYQLIGRVNEKSEIIKLLSDTSSQEFEVISICGMGGLGKTTLVKDVYQSQELSGMFDKRACITIKRPFNPKELLSSLAMQLGDNQQQLPNILEGKKYLIVLDDLSSTEEWDAIRQDFPTTESRSRIIVTTRVENIANHCSKKQENIHKLKILGEKDACNLFTEKVFGKTTNLDEQCPELAEVAKLILKKCNGLPLAIVTIGGFLSKQPKNPMEWRKLNDHIGVEWELNQELGTIKDILIKSYDGLPYHLKSCFLYMSVFPEDHKISRRRLVRRWIAEGYASGVHGKSVKETADSYFMDLIDRSMILPFQKSIGCRNGSDSCQVHDLMREISISKSMEENLVFRMEDGCCLDTSGIARHLSISSNWKGDQREFESLVDLSRVRSLTVFGSWKPFYISDKMWLLRVLDLEGTEGLFDHHLKQIGMLIHLKYLSLRSCGSIFHLPDSLANLKQLQTLDIRGTRVFKLPQCIIYLRKLQYISAGGSDILGKFSYEEFEGELPEILRNKLGTFTAISRYCFLACCVNKVREKLLGDKEGGSNRRDVCTWCCHAGLPFIARLVDPEGVVVPKGLSKLKALHKLGIVNIARGMSILQEIKYLTQLRKLAVVGINRKNCQKFCSILADLNSLETLSAASEEEHGLQGLLDGVLSPPKSLQSLKLEAKLIKLPEWIGRLQNLAKLKLSCTEMSDVDGTLQVLGKLPSLAILRLWYQYFCKGKLLSVTFHREEFPNLMVLEISEFVGSLEFEEGAMPKLELLRFYRATGFARLISGLASLPSLKEVMLEGDCKDDVLESMQAQLADNKSGAILKRE